MLGLIVVLSNDEERTKLALSELLGAPVLSRSIGAALPTKESVAGVLVCSKKVRDKIQKDVIERFGFDEIDDVVSCEGDWLACVRAGEKALPKDIDVVVIQDACRALAPSGLVDTLVESARKQGIAVPGADVRSEVASVTKKGTLSMVSSQTCEIQGPVVAKRESLQALMESKSDGSWIFGTGESVTRVASDLDNFLVQSDHDIGRAIEVFSRRAADYAFVYPRDLLPDDPLAAAMASAKRTTSSSD